MTLTIAPMGILIGVIGMVWGWSARKDQQKSQAEWENWRERAEAFDAYQQSWREFSSCLIGLSPVLVAQIKVVVEETGRAADELILRFQDIAQRARDQANESSSPSDRRIPAECVAHSSSRGAAHLFHCVTDRR